MKKRTYVILLSFAVLFLSYNFYSSRLETFTVENLSAQERFNLYKHTNSKPANIDLVVHGQTDSTFSVTVIGLPSKATLFDSSFNSKQVDYECKVDYYEGNGTEIIYTPKGVKKGSVIISARINSDFQK